ncbi:uncharacterized protein LOC143854621 isoform X1 [Tasmannia lanceolata]|uniref:uncharacterized protein LOC143854621 isoform X1 n=1 Tax=Tasmannia lanceolata TaxID=3420 RepID=UPI00406337F4
MERFYAWFHSLLVQNSSISTSLLLILLLYSFSSQFLPIEPYLVPYLTSVKHFSNFQVTVDIYPYSVYSQLIFTLLMAPAGFYLSHKMIVALGAFGMLITYLIIWVGHSILAMQIMQITYGFGMASRLIFSAYIFLLVPEEEYQTMTSLTTTTSLLSFMLASELGQLLALEKVSFAVFFILTFISLGVCFSMTLLLPKDHSSILMYPSVTTFWSETEGWIRILKETWHGRNLRILSLWWALAYASFSLVQNYGTNLFDAIDPDSKFNGHVLAASQAAGSLGSFCAIYLEDFAIKSGMLIYVLGSAVMGVVCVFMGVSLNIWAAYLMFVMVSGIYQTLACLVSVRCGRLLSNKQFILLFSVNNFAGLLLETLLQATVELSGLSIFVQFITFSGFFFLATAIFLGLCIIDISRKRSSSALESKPEPLISEPLDL